MELLFSFFCGLRILQTMAFLELIQHLFSRVKLETFFSVSISSQTSDTIFLAKLTLVSIVDTVSALQPVSLQQVSLQSPIDLPVGSESSKWLRASWKSSILEASEYFESARCNNALELMECCCIIAFIVRLVFVKRASAARICEDKLRFNFTMSTCQSAWKIWPVVDKSRMTDVLLSNNLSMQEKFIRLCHHEHWYIEIIQWHSKCVNMRHLILDLNFP